MKKTMLAMAVILIFTGTTALDARGGGGSGRGGGSSGGGSWSGGGRSGGWGSGSRGGWGGTSRWNGGGGRNFSNYRGFRNGGHFNRSFRGSPWNRGSGWNGGARNHFNRSNGFNRANGTGNTQSRAAFNRQGPTVPSRGPLGRSLTAARVSPRMAGSPLVKNRMAALAGNKAIGRIGGFNGGYLRNHYYWHNWNGFNYCNYYDAWGGNWWGWDCGAGFFWAQYYGGNWWWQDPNYGNWCYWDSGNWCWRNPVNETVYAYENGDYVPDNGNAQAQGDNSNQEPPSNGGTGPDRFNHQDPGRASQDSGIDFQSGGSSRFVKLVGEAGDAFLYDKDSQSFKPVFLETGVKGVRFSGSGWNLKIQLTLRDGSVDNFNSEGESLKGA